MATLPCKIWLSVVPGSTPMRSMVRLVGVRLASRLLRHFIPSDRPKDPDQPAEAQSGDVLRDRSKSQRCRKAGLTSTTRVAEHLALSHADRTSRHAPDMGYRRPQPIG